MKNKAKNANEQIKQKRKITFKIKIKPIHFFSFIKGQNKKYKKKIFSLFNPFLTFYFTFFTVNYFWQRAPIDIFLQSFLIVRYVLILNVNSLSF